MSILKEFTEKRKFLITQVLLIIQVFITVAVCRGLIDLVLLTKVTDMTQQVTITLETVQTMQNVRSQGQQRQRAIVMFYQERQM